DLAQAWAEKIALSGITPPEHRDIESIGENIVWGTAGAFSPQFLVGRWGGEVSKYNLATNTCTPEYACLHFTQIVWSKTTKLGCGKATTPDGKIDFVVCDYSPPGNFRGQTPFPPIPPTTAKIAPSLAVECDDLRKTVEQLTAQVAQLKQQIDDTANIPKPSPTPTANCPTTNKYGIKFVPIPAAVPFCMGKYEVTQDQWKAVVGNSPSRGDCDDGDCPVESVRWNDVQDFLTKLNALGDGFKYRLPNEVEWEFSARAGSTGDYYGPIRDIAWYDRNSGEEPHPVGKKKPNAFGLYDMSGNVWEWCQDWYDDNEYKRVLRGGSWHSTSRRVRTKFRSGLGPSHHEDYIGFRVLAQR
ncbi:MAG: SUMF1/EgtB/PvdO family nonheme iron enzyme, partial [Pyrinomonadaceae bacterium]